MPASTKPPGEYSTNPNTIKARHRKMSLTGAKKVEDAARTADYKAMIYARKHVQQKPSYADASEAEKATMLEEAMRDTMEKRRSRGQDTMSKMAAFRSGTYRDRDGAATGPPQTRVPISAFLQDNGFVPSRPGRASQRVATAGTSNPDSAPASPGIKAYASPEPMLASVEGDPMAEAEMGIDNNRMRDLEVRLSRMEGRVHAIEHTTLGNYAERFNELEGAVKELEGKVGSGADAEVAKMREVMGSLKVALDKVGGFA